LFLLGLLARRFTVGHKCLGAWKNIKNCGKCIEENACKKITQKKEEEAEKAKQQDLFKGQKTSPKKAIIK
jgi:hypothetical protein